jgi:hypothetical protein
VGCVYIGFSWYTDTADTATGHSVFDVGQRQRRATNGDMSGL